ncbi:hypothetical protein RGU41_18920 [Cryobacterium sp. 10C3]|nr:hypothetical protein [Cryobacterium sp. 10C3]MDY7558637.1 hypothetical protein [Cryobacterium sp. 10C3]
MTELIAQAGSVPPPGTLRPIGQDRTVATGVSGSAAVASRTAVTRSPAVFARRRTSSLSSGAPSWKPRAVARCQCRRASVSAASIRRSSRPPIASTAADSSSMGVRAKSGAV